jgi:hypothetical protein
MWSRFSNADGSSHTSRCHGGLTRARTAGTRWTRKFARRRLSSSTGPRVAATRGTALIPRRRPSPRGDDPRGREETPVRRRGFRVDAGDTPGARRPERQGPAREETPPELALSSVPPAEFEPAAPALDVVSVGESAVADEGCGDADEGQEVLGLSLVTAVQPSASGQPGDRSLDDPAMPAEPRGRLDALAGDAVADTTLAKPFPQVVVVVALVCMELGRTPAARSAAGADGRDPRTSGCRLRLSCMFAPETPSDSGTPFRSVMRWIFDPGLPRSVGFGPVSGPLLPPGR